MWIGKQFDLGVYTQVEIAEWLNEIGAQDAKFVQRSGGILLAFARVEAKQLAGGTTKLTVRKQNGINEPAQGTQAAKRKKA